MIHFIKAATVDRKIAACLLSIILLLPLPGSTPLVQAQQPSQAPEPAATGRVFADDEVVLAVGEKKITAKQFREILTALPPQFAALYGQMGAQAFAEQYASLLGLSQEAEKRDIDKTDSFRLMYDFERRVVLAQVMADEITKTAASVSDEEVEYYYTTHEPEFEQMKVRGIHIPIATRQTRAAMGPPPIPGQKSSLPKPQYNEQNAQRRALQLRSMIMSRLVDMGEAAKTDSDHPTSEKGGDFGWVRRVDLPAEISNSVFNMTLTQISAPLRDKTGFFLIRLEGKRVQPLAEVRERIRASLSIEKLNTYLMQIREHYPVTYNQEFYNSLTPQKEPAKPAPSAAPAPKAAAPAKAK